MQFNIDIPTPKTILELIELISSLKSRRTIYQTMITQLRVSYMKSDSGPAEMRMNREDQAFVTEKHLEQTIQELEERINYLDAQIEELQDQPVGGGTPPAAVAVTAAKETTSSEQAQPAVTPSGEQQVSVLPLAGPSVTTEKKEQTSVKPPRHRPS